MSRRFNTAGPCKPDIHYMLPPLRRLPTVRRLIDDQSYFVIHAPRQVGKTTALKALARDLTREGRYVAAQVSAQIGAPFSQDVGAAEDAILSAWRLGLEDTLPPDLWPPPWPDAAPGNRVRAALRTWSHHAPRPVVLLLDEIDALEGEALLSVLRQLRDGFEYRPEGFPWSLALVGMRSVRDYKLASGGADRTHSTSPFNILAESLTLRNFTRDEVAELYRQHTDETGQAFRPDAVERAYALTEGQPWLVNALARQLVEVVVPDAARAITAADVDEAKELLIRRQDTHLDSLAERLRERRIRGVIEPILAGGEMGDVPADDLRLVQDLGLARMSATGGLEIANAIYREVIPRCLATTAQASIPSIAPSWLRADGKLDLSRLRDAFLAFWRQHGEPLLGTAPYHEIAPHLVMMAFLHRVVNGGGTLEREYAIGSGRMDLRLQYGETVLGIELKVWRDGKPDPAEEGLAQLDRYLAGLGRDAGWLVVFDRRSGQPPIAARTTAEAARTPEGRDVTLIRA